MGKFVSYLRVSTARQGEGGLGVEAQRVAVANYLGRVSGLLVAEHVEVESGAKKTRPVLARAINQCRREKATLVIAKLDRLARNVAFVSSLMDGGVDFVAVDMPTANRLMLHILAAFAEHEREAISERTKAALAAAKARGVLLGRNGRVLADQHQAAALASAEGYRSIATQIICDGTKTYRELAQQLNNAGVVTRQGAAWRASSAWKLARRLGLAFR